MPPRIQTVLKIKLLKRIRKNRTYFYNQRTPLKQNNIIQFFVAWILDRIYIQYIFLFLPSYKNCFNDEWLYCLLVRNLGRCSAGHVWPIGEFLNLAISAAFVQMTVPFKSVRTRTSLNWSAAEPHCRYFGLQSLQLEVRNWIESSPKRLSISKTCKCQHALC